MSMAATMPPAPGDRPETGNSSMKTAPLTSASVALPSALPVTMAARGAGEASTPCRKPSWRSSMIEMVEKRAVNRTISASEPGK